MMMLRSLCCWLLLLSGFAHAEQKIALFTFATDNGAWIDPIASNFKHQLSRAKEAYNIIEYSMPDDEAGYDSQLQTLKAQKPDFLVFPDDLLYVKYSPKIKALIGDAKTVVFVTNIEKRDLGVMNDERVLFNEFPGQHVCEQIRKHTKLERIAIMGNPWSMKLEKKLTASMSTENVTIHREGTWSEWKSTLQSLEQKADAIFVLMPFGVRDENGQLVEFHKTEPLLRALKVPTIGFGRLGSQAPMRTFTVGMIPKEIGSEMADMVVHGVQNQEKPYASKDVMLHQEDLLRLGLAK